MSDVESLEVGGRLYAQELYGSLRAIQAARSSANFVAGNSRAGIPSGSRLAINPLYLYIRPSQTRSKHGARFLVRMAIEIIVCEHFFFSFYTASFPI